MGEDVTAAQAGDVRRQQIRRAVSRPGGGGADRRPAVLRLYYFGGVTTPTDRRLMTEPEVPMPTIRVVTDSTCDLPDALVREYAITVIPVSVHARRPDLPRPRESDHRRAPAPSQAGRAPAQHGPPAVAAFEQVYRQTPGQPALRRHRLHPCLVAPERHLQRRADGPRCLREQLLPRWRARLAGGEYGPGPDGAGRRPQGRRRRHLERGDATPPSA